MPEIILKDITKMYGSSAAVDHLNLSIDDRAFITLLGPSGCGKTTTLRMIAGLETPTSGEISIDGRVVFSSEKGINVAPEKRGVGFLFQNYALWPHMTVYQNITFGLENLKWDKSKIKARADELMDMLKIKEYSDRYPAELSGGQQQRVAIARTLSTGPRILLMDEPLSNLDAKLRMEMRSELKRLHMETDSTFVYVTHDQLEAMTLATKISLMKKGVLQQYAPPLTMYQRSVVPRRSASRARQPRHGASRPKKARWQGRPAASPYAAREAGFCPRTASSADCTLAGSGSSSKTSGRGIRGASGRSAGAATPATGRGP